MKVLVVDECLGFVRKTLWEVKFELPKPLPVLYDSHILNSLNSQSIFQPNVIDRLLKFIRKPIIIK